MKCTDLLERLDYDVLSGDTGVEIKRICYDSRKVKPGDLFLCISGANFDAHTRVDEVASNGAAAILVEREVPVPKDFPGALIQVRDTRVALAYVSAAWFGYPAEKLRTIGVTGTKGKTSTTYMIRDILESVGVRCGLIGTIETIVGTERKANLNTTPESYEIQEAFARMVDAHVEAVVMEVSSQGLMLHRTDGILFDYACFTNLSPDHIGPNEHKDFDDYKRCKALLFHQCKNGIFNADDPYCEEMMKDTDCIRETYGIDHEADYRAGDIELFVGNGFLGTRYRMSGRAELDAELSVPGRFSVYNSLLAAAVGLHFTRNLKRIREALKNVRVRGRAEIIPVKDIYTVMIDYAHNAVALESLLKTIREYHPKRIVTLFGCGGNRDRNRRFEMGEVSARLSDLTIVTSDNPRKEDPEAIIDDILVGVKKAGTSEMQGRAEGTLTSSSEVAQSRDGLPASEMQGRYIRITDRREAIRYALENGQEGDVIILAGKGHEDYQEINGKKYPMDERVIIREIKKSWNSADK